MVERLEERVARLERQARRARAIAAASALVSLAIAALVVWPWRRAAVIDRSTHVAVSGAREREVDRALPGVPDETSANDTNTDTNHPNTNTDVNGRANAKDGANGKSPTGGGPVVADVSAPDRAAKSNSQPLVDNTVLVGGAASIAGAVRFRGAPPPRPRLKMTSDPFCARHAIDDETVIVNANGTLKNVVVRVLGQPAAPPPPSPAVVAQRDCQYRPRVQGLVFGQKLEIENADPVLHNVHAYQGSSTLFNVAQVPSAPGFVRQNAAIGLHRLKCDVHQWMTGYVFIHENRLIAVTGDDGAFAFAGLAPGRYTLEAWHERFGTRRAEVVVAANAPAAATFSFAEGDEADR
jgi:plastocyanin